MELDERYTAEIDQERQKYEMLREEGVYEKIGFRV